MNENSERFTLHYAVDYVHSRFGTVIPTQVRMQEHPLNSGPDELSVFRYSEFHRFGADMKVVVKSVPAGYQ